MRVPGVIRVISAGAVALTAAGCDSSTGPLTDLSDLGAELTLVDTIFTSPIVRSLGYFPLVVPLPPPAAGAPLVPDSLLGKTMAGSCTTQRYAVTNDSGAPATGVRFLLYELAPAGSIPCPATAIGQLDLFDASTTGTTAVHGTVRESGGGGQPVVDYTITHAVGDPPAVTSASGFVSDGQQRLVFEVSGSPGSGVNTTVSTVQLDDSAADYHEVLHYSAMMGVDTYSDGLDLTASHAGSIAELKGSTGRFNTGRSWDETVTVDDVPLAKVGGILIPDGGQPTITPADGRLFFTSEELAILRDFVNAPATVRGGLYRVLGAGAHLVRIGF
ncbi:MAG TPA: hypothetical protein VH158_01480 [Gemmatimonadales bacterium]|nr:hypothetical protein [Gemmatimonadales bacterium]